jgi:hypothetical protein
MKTVLLFVAEVIAATTAALFAQGFAGSNPRLQPQ